MASLIHCNLVSLFYLIFLLLIISYPPNTLSQDPNSSSPTIAPCTSSLLPLFPCMPFVQGAVRTPASACCSNLERIYNQQPHCLCFLFNSTTFTSFPINRTLALQIPALCNLPVNSSVCQGEKIHVPATSPKSQAFFGTKNNSTVFASPAFTVPPRPSIIGFGFGRSEAINLKAKNGMIVIINITIFVFILVS
ncbi:non-specific lipid transfer protein GPI-anchored 10 [Trifolium pratense]|uniref:non-specific lipid transfer protein GPI-anchored 10 n=1 Tax=Trifolium pratense TaxID=57577 RepID=UPI001E692915|nr:non-specific lipid transfer protein GPI-anchored 10 [Trifolium pratense]